VPTNPVMSLQQHPQSHPTHRALWFQMATRAFPSRKADNVSSNGSSKWQQAQERRAERRKNDPLVQRRRENRERRERQREAEAKQAEGRRTRMDVAAALAEAMNR
jgi:beta-phosphoglucomutase-like phosphatase (HAD superfamily)